jgi:deoxyadenosine/deoxycytidine kinase
MNNLISIVGITGAGKTTLARALCQHGNFEQGLEQHGERPFQVPLKTNPRFALANQVDYLLQRAKQESRLRQSTHLALVDGGLDLDFHCFTRLFHARGLLSEEEFLLCSDLYSFFRSILPLPDLIIRLVIEHERAAKRLSERDRINIARPEDLGLLDRFLDDWLSSLPLEKVFLVDITNEDRQFSKTIPLILEQISRLSAP